MFGRIFYHSLLRKYAILFGNMFNDIEIRRFDANNNVVKQIPVPITYAPKRKWVYALNQSYEPTERKVAIQLPRMCFFFNSPSYDAGRQLNVLNKQKKITDDKNTLYSVFQPIPYKLNVELCVFAKNHDDGAQIIEQIIPYFAPDFTNSINLIPTLDRKMDIVTRLQGIQVEDIYEGTFQQRQVIVWTLVFEMDVWFVGPIQKQGVIKRVDVDLVAVSGGGKITNEDYINFGRNVRIEITPGLTEDGNPTTKKSESIDYLEIEKEDDYGFVTEIEDFEDGLRYNPVTDKDEEIK